MPTLSWNAVTTHTDGSSVASPVETVTGYDIYDAAGNTNSKVDHVTGTTWPLPASLAVGDHSFTVVAIDSDTTRNSAPSSPISYTVHAPAPPLSAPTGLSIS